MFVRGPFGSSAAASYEAHALDATQGGNYVVYATGSANLTSLIKLVAGCLAPGTQGFTF